MTERAEIGVEMTAFVKDAGVARELCTRLIGLDFGPSLAILEGIMPERSKKRPRDPNQLAYQIMLESTGQAPKQQPQVPKTPHAVALGRLGGAKGGPARAAKLSARKRSEIAARAAKARWSKKDR